MTYDALVYALLTFCAGLLALGTILCLIRAIKGPTTTDRLVAVNMTGTQVIAMICIVAARSGEYGFIDVAIVYGLLSFLAVTVLTRILDERRARK